MHQCPCTLISQYSFVQLQFSIGYFGPTILIIGTNKTYHQTFWRRTIYFNDIEFTEEELNRNQLRFLIKWNDWSFVLNVTGGLYDSLIYNNIKNWEGKFKYLLIKMCFFQRKYWQFYWILHTYKFLSDCLPFLP